MNGNRIALAAVLVAVAALPRPARAGDADDLAAVLDRVAPSIVTVRVVIKTEVMMMGQAQNEETRSDLQGVVVDGSGMVMISNAEISSDRMKEALAGGPFAAGMEIKVTPTEFEVIFGNEPQEYAAFLVAKDTKLDLAFIQVQDLAGREPTPVSFADSAAARIGDEVVVVSRLQKGYDYAPYFAAARINGAIRKPRKAWTVDGNLTGYGLPVFTVSGDVLGVLVTLTPTTKQESSAGGFGGLMRFMQGGGMGTGVGTFVLPGNVVDGLIGQAKQKAREMLAEQAEQPEEADTAAGEE
jgi:S1-C subfamily serine protease